MQLRRDAHGSNGDAEASSMSESSEWRDGPKPQSSYGETSSVWRCVPDLVLGS